MGFVGEGLGGRSERSDEQPLVMTNSRLSDWPALPAMLEQNASHFGARAALLSDGDEPLSHQQLWDQAAMTVPSLNRLGVGRGDRVAIVLPQGPNLAVTFLAVAAGATAAPLNPAYVGKEFLFYLEDLQARALILPKGSDSPARAAADSLGTPVIELVPGKNGAERFHLSGVARPLEARAGLAEADDVALVLHTSGTTSRPKMVPLTHRNLLASVRHIGATLQLQPTDRCLNVMPLFHIHGLVACVLASLGAGGSTVCTRAFGAEKFPGWLEHWKPSWYSAVPTMHQAILAHARARPIQPLRSSLRFIRSSSAALPPPVMAGLEEAFGVAVIESYGMTEAAHQMASNPLPPRTRKPGSVGLAAGPDVAILDEAGKTLASGRMGEVAIRGPNVTRGYANNPEANATTFSDGWFRTGDQGYFDGEGYLFITDRLKELINRGGEKIAPREIDEVLLAYPGVRQAVTFAVPHPSLGENIAAAVVLKDGAVGCEAVLREFALDRLPTFKVPSRIILVKDVPKGPTGKIQRIGLADRLAAALVVAYEAPTSDMERLVAATICQVLGREVVGRNDNFFSLGGDSLRATQVLTRLGQSLGFQIPVPAIFRCPTPALLANKLDLMREPEVDALAAELEKLPPEERASLLNDL
ncbi:MAG: AMP-dependent synthetase [Verrucomicrobia bacterium]|nr:MAG: AMP-dependent synthetase [Verrucomicrobiota bacterium]